MLTDAFLKAGLATVDDVNRIEKEKAKEKIAKAKEKSKESPKVHPAKSHLKNEKHKVFCDLWNSKKSLKFALHLVHSFSIIKNVKPVMDALKEVKAKPCCMCKTVVHKASLFKDNDMDKVGVMSTKSDSMFCRKCYMSFRMWLFDEMMYNRTIENIVGTEWAKSEGLRDKVEWLD